MDFKRGNKKRCFVKPPFPQEKGIDLKKTIDTFFHAELGFSHQ